MSNFTDADVLAAIDKARQNPEAHDPDGPFFRWAMARNSHCDDLRATAERHAPVFIVNTDPPVAECRHDWARGCDRLQWPCDDYRQVIDRLTGWGVL